ncbi:hypothetical protein D1953_11375 [Peribacillus asahii]|uniref:Uncharacterized protein n=1 Tax=Peribacillus asahii TaxID=228899 RepID=A0A398B999_9BACI|nr:hypothetical protein [Peribacillus asahii]RID85408.1 hypothetical protein D1953_11375 [Peribacillus asahii]
MKLDDRIDDFNQSTSLYPFLNQLIDYAGIFPPTSLTLDEAIRNYASYQLDKDSWMLGPFIVQASRLDELDRYITLFTKERPLTISAVGTKTSNPTEHHKILLADLNKIDLFRKRHGQVVQITTLEVPLLPNMPDLNLLNTISKETAKLGLQTYCEVPVPFNDEWEKTLHKSLDVIAAHNSKSSVTLGFKLRTGGVTDDAFPNPRQVALAIKGCCDRNLAMKFTAGLHHPIRMYREEIAAKMHGFINVFVAGMLTHLYHLDLPTIEKIIADEEVSNFTFHPNGISWCGLEMTNNEIKNLRDSVLRSYGCCSFDEPREDMQALAIL